MCTIRNLIFRALYHNGIMELWIFALEKGHIQGKIAANGFGYAVAKQAFLVYGKKNPLKFN